jgi:hypothetical protein
VEVGVVGVVTADGVAVASAELLNGVKGVVVAG